MIKTDDGEGYTFKRDIAGRITEVYDPDGNIIDTYEYDKRGNVTLHKHCYSEENRELNNKIKENPNVGDK